MFSKFHKILKKENIARLTLGALFLGLSQTIAVITPNVSQAADEGSIEFSSGAFLSAPSTQNLSVSNDWTIEGYFKTGVGTTTSSRYLIRGYSSNNTEQLRIFLGPSHYLTGSGYGATNKTSGAAVASLVQFTNVMGTTDTENNWIHFVFQNKNSQACGAVQSSSSSAAGPYTWTGTQTPLWNCYLAAAYSAQLTSVDKITRWEVGTQGNMANIRVSNIARYDSTVALPKPTDFVSKDASTLFFLGNDNTSSNYLDSTGNLVFTKNGTIANSSTNPGLVTAVSTYSISSSVTGANGTLTQSGAGTYNSGTSPTITVTPSAGYSLATLTDNGIDESASVVSNIYTLSNLASNHTIVATFTPNSNAVTWNDHGATAASSGGSTTYATSSSIAAIPTTEPQKTGSAFSGWNTLADGSGAAVTAGSYTPSTPFGAKTLYAQWTLNTYNVSFASGEHGTITGTSSQTIGHGSSATTVSATPDSNYHFSTWSDGSIANPRTLSNVETNTSLTANFSIDTYPVTYAAVANGAITGTSPQSINHGESATAVTATPSAHYHFDSWSDGVTTATRQDTIVTGALSRSASFVIDTHAVTYDAHGGIGGASVDVNYSDDAILRAPTVTRDQYTFAGWAESTTASVLSSWNVIGVKTLYALWSPKTYTITYLPESGTAFVSSETFTVGSAPLLLQSASRTGYKFDGWFSAKTGGTAVGLAGSGFTPTETATVHAQWTQASLVGLTSPISFGSITATPSLNGGISADANGTGIDINYYADTLPENTVIRAYLQGNTVRAAEILNGVQNLLLSVVVAWKAPDETVPEIDPSKSAIKLKITNASIKRGAKVYAIVGDSSTVLTTATQDGFVIIDLREDPEIVIANPVEVPTPPSPPIISAPTIVILDNSALENEAKENEAKENEAKEKADADLKLAVTLNAQEEKAAIDLQIARDKAEAQIKAAQDAEAKQKAQEKIRTDAEFKASQDAALAARIASHAIAPDFTLYSISPSLTLSAYDTAYLRKYVSALKPKAVVTCIGYIYTQGAKLNVATSRAKRQAESVCATMKKMKPTLTTKVSLLSSRLAPKAATGAKWVAVSYRVDGFKG